MGDYKLGDVAMVKNQYGVWLRCIYTLVDAGSLTLEGWRPGVADTFYHANGIPDHHVRPVTVIDHDDLDSVQELLDTLRAGGWIQPPTAKPLHVTLREGAEARAKTSGPIVKPVRPEAIGAVVEDHEETFVHVGGGRFLRTELDEYGGYLEYDWEDLSSWVKILSSGGYYPDADAL